MNTCIAARRRACSLAWQLLWPGARVLTRAPRPVHGSPCAVLVDRHHLAGRKGRVSLTIRGGDEVAAAELRLTG